ncbi:MAG: hypothetical protein AAGL11_08385 [Pseudomonadota bacterium]
MMRILTFTEEIILRGREAGDAVVVHLAETPNAMEALPQSFFIGLGALFISAGVAISIELRAEQRRG